MIALHADGTIRWWDRETGQLLYQSQPESPIDGLAVRPDGRVAAGLGGRGVVDIYDLRSGQILLTLLPLREGQWLALRPDGHYRSSPGVEKEIVYVVQTDAGQEVLAPNEFAKKYGWKNNPSACACRIPNQRDNV